ncbi:hypothetical protein ACFLUZ_06425 [Chloroflexota bacterium]
MDDPGKGLIPTEDEIRTILSVAQTDPMELPAAMLQVQIARLISIMFKRMSKKLSKEADELQKSINKAIGKNPDNDVPR